MKNLFKKLPLLSTFILMLIFGGSVPAYAMILTGGGTTASIGSQMANLSYLAYQNLPVNYVTGDGWKLYKFYSNNFTSFQLQVYRKPNGQKYDYAFAFRGTQEPMDFVEDAVQVVGNLAGLQIGNAESTVKMVLTYDKNAINNVYFTGHSLGGYLASWVESDVVEGSISVPHSSHAIVFNAPGLSPNIAMANPADISFTNKARISQKIANDIMGKYDNYIQNNLITYDVIGAFGWHMGKVTYYKRVNSKLSYHAVLNWAYENI